MQTPLFSVVIPSHNQKDRLVATLESIAASDFDIGQVEVVVVDDGSTDGTYEMLEQADYPFELRLDRVEFASQSLTTNRGIELARGTYVLSSAHDILFDRQLFRKHLQWHERAGDDDIVVLGYLPYPPGLEVTPFMHYLVTGGYQFAYFLIRDRLNVPPNFLYAPNFSVRREVFERVGMFDKALPYGCQDTDLGFRFAEAGVRIVYEPEAIGFHNHPVDLAGYCRRQEVIGRSMLQLERQQPDYEGGHGIRDMVVEQYLMCSQNRLDEAYAAIETLEPLLRKPEHANYQAIWDFVFCRPSTSTSLTDQDTKTYWIVQRLYKAYHRILGYHWTRGYFDRAIEEDGPEHAARWVRSRTIKGQFSIQLKRVLRSRLRAHGIDSEVCGPRDYRVSRIVPDLEDYASAIAYLEPFQNLPPENANCQLILVVDPDRFDDDQRSRLEEVAEIVVDADEDRGVRAALARCASDVVMIASSRVEPLQQEHETLVGKLFERIPALTALCGGLDTDDGRRLCGHGEDGAPLITEPSVRDGMLAVDTPIRELCCLRGSAVETLLADTSGSAPEGSWNRDLGSRLKREGQQFWHIPELNVRLRSEDAGLAGVGGMTHRNTSGDRACEVVEVSRIPETPRLCGFNIDMPATGWHSDTFTVQIAGWVAAREIPVKEVEIAYNGLALRRTPVSLERPDVAEIHGEKAAKSGFDTAIGLASLPRECRVGLAAILDDGSREPLAEIALRRAPVASSFTPKIQPLMVTSLFRMGTTRLMRLLSEHTQITVERTYPYETCAASYWLHAFKILTEPANLYESSHPNEFVAEHRWIGHNPYYRQPIAGAPGVARWMGRESIEDVAAFCQRSAENFYETVTRDQGEDLPKFFAEKHLPYSHVPDTLYELYPGAREVFLVRDLRDVVCSMLAFNKKRGFPSFGRQKVDSDEEMIELFAENCRRLAEAWQRRSRSALLVRYEDLIHQPAETIAAVLEHAAIDHDTETVRALLERADRDTPELAFHRTTKDPRSSIGRWHRDLSLASAARVNELLGASLKAFGYEPGVATTSGS